VPPSTRQLARDAAAFYGEEPGTVSDQAMAQARALKNGLNNRPPSTRQFAQAYKAFYDVPEMGQDSALAQVRAIRNSGASQTAPKSFRLATGLRQDPNFRANQAAFHGSEANQEDAIYKNYRAFYGGATPNVNQASHMGAKHKDQQKQLLRNKLAENAKRILNTKNFDDGFKIEKKNISQSQVLSESGFDASKAMAKPKEMEPASYMQHESTGQSNFGYARNKQADKVTKCDPPIKNLGKLRYNIITGSLQEWF